MCRYSGHNFRLLKRAHSELRMFRPTIKKKMLTTLIVDLYCTQTLQSSSPFSVHLDKVFARLPTYHQALQWGVSKLSMMTTLQRDLKFGQACWGRQVHAENCSRSRVAQGLFSTSEASSRPVITPDNVAVYIACAPGLGDKMTSSRWSS